MTTVRKQGTFRAQHAEKTRRAAQRTALPPRCESCRLPGTIAVEHDGITHFYCNDHTPLGICTCPHGPDAPVEDHWFECKIDKGEGIGND